MCYKDKVQRDNAEKLQRKFDKDNTPGFIQKYFINIESKVGAINYYIAIKDLLVWLMENKTINRNIIAEIIPDDFYNVESEDVTMYLKQKEQSGMSPTTLETRKNIFRSFWNYLVRIKTCPVSENIILDVSYNGISSNNINLIKKLPTDKQISSMEEKIMHKNNEFLRLRNYAAFKILINTGLRESELSYLEFKDMHLEEDIPYLKIVGKGVYREIEARTVYLTGSTVKAIVDWLSIRKTIEIKEEDNINLVFINSTGNRFTESDIYKMCKVFSNNTITPHMLRHWYSTIVASTGNLAFAQQQLGHSSLNTTVNNYANGAYGMKDILANM